MKSFLESEPYLIVSITLLLTCVEDNLNMIEVDDKITYIYYYY